MVHLEQLAQLLVAPGDRLGVERAVDLPALAALTNGAAHAQHAQVPGDPWLAHAHGRGQVVDARLPDLAQPLVRLEIALAKQEAKELAIRNGIAIGLMAGGALFAMLGLLIGVPVLIVELTGRWWVAAIWVLLYVLGGAAAILIGRTRLKIEAPPRTISSLKETRAWVLSQLTTSSR